MPNGPEQNQQQQKRSEFLGKKLWDMFYNRIIAGPLGWRRRSYELYEKPGEYAEPLIKREPEMNVLKALKDTLLAAGGSGLAQVESFWEKGDDIITTLVGKAEGGNFSLGDYSKLGPYTDIYVLIFELKYYSTGADYKIEQTPLSVDELRVRAQNEGKNNVVGRIAGLSTDERNDIQQRTYTKVTIGGGDLIWDPRDPTAREKIYSFGYLRLNQLNVVLTSIRDSWDDTTRPGIWPGAPVKTPILAGFAALQETLKSIGQKEEEHYNFLKSLLSVVREFRGVRNTILDHRPPAHKIRFAHTYKIIQPFIFVYKNTGAKVDIIEELQKIDPTQPSEPDKPSELDKFLDNIEVKYFDQGNHPNYETRIDEVGPMLDENGMPLEVDSDGTVLLDKWWWEIGENEWQMKRIKDKGDDKIIEKIDRMKALGKARAIRKIDPDFVNYLDILEMATYISNEWDTFRDDLRDGRHHPWSKTSDDYVISIEGFGMYVPYQVRKIRFPMRYIGGNCNPIDLSNTNQYSYIKAKPELFETNEFEPPDEKNINRRFRMKLLDGRFYPTDEMLRDDPYANAREPTHLNPAFDRRAINFAAGWIHWGRMYYYEWPDGVNRWSENPYPHISTRGISKYIIHRILNDAFYYKQAVKDIEDSVGYDIGIRRPLLKGDFLKNPLQQVMSR